MLMKIKRNNFDELKAIKKSKSLLQKFRERRSTRAFTGYQINSEVINNAIATAATAPSGANKQPWLFCSISCTKMKKEIRFLSEIEEENFYLKKPNKNWLKDLSHLHTNEDKSFLEDASHLILIFFQNQTTDDEGNISKNYYAKESTGLATGMLLSNLHLSGVSTLTYTPKRMQFMREYLSLDKSYTPFMMIVAGVAPEELEVPSITKKSFEEVTRIF